MEIIVKVVQVECFIANSVGIEFGVTQLVTTFSAGVAYFIVINLVYFHILFIRLMLYGLATVVTNFLLICISIILLGP